MVEGTFQRVRERVSECRKAWVCGMQAHVEEGVAEGTPGERE